MRGLVQVAAEAGVETFDVSLELLLRHLPDFMRQGGDLLSRIQEAAYPLGIIRREPHASVWKCPPLNRSLDHPASA